ncbi:hypothetical protein D3C84_978580 [compost metagenome]
MSDWRTKPRNGKSQVVPLMGEIQSKLDLGHTIKAIYTALVESGKLEIGYHQFTLYIKKLRHDAGRAVDAPRVAPVKLKAEHDPRRPRRFVHNPTPPDNILD